MSYQNLILAGQKPYQNLDINNLLVRGGSEFESDVIFEDVFVNSIESSLGPNENVRINQHTAFDVDKEFLEWTGTVDNLAGSQVDLSTMAIVNAGHSPYVPLVNIDNKEVFFIERGGYMITFNIIATSAFLPNDVVNFSFLTPSDLGNTRWIECICTGSGSPANTVSSTFSGVYVHRLAFPVIRAFKFLSTKLSGPSSPSFDVKCNIVRLF